MACLEAPTRADATTWFIGIHTMKPVVDFPLQLRGSIDARLPSRIIGLNLSKLMIENRPLCLAWGGSVERC